MAVTFSGSASTDALKQPRTPQRHSRETGTDRDYPGASTPRDLSVRDVPISAACRLWLVALLVIGDLGIVLAGLAGSGALHDETGWGALFAGPVAAAGLLGAGSSLGLYDVGTARRMRRAAFGALRLGSIAAMLLWFGAFGFVDNASAAWISTIVAAAVLATVLLRVFVAGWVERRAESFAERVLLVAGPRSISGLRGANVLSRLIGMIAVRGGADPASATACGDAAAAAGQPPVIAVIDPCRPGAEAAYADFRCLAEALRGHARTIDRAVILGDGFDEATLAAIVGRLEHLPFEIALRPAGASLGASVGDNSDPLDRAACLTLRRAAITPWGLVCKRALDIAGAASLLLILAPVLLIIAALVRRGSPGPVLFRQTRWGWNNEPFTVFKFRTMWADAPGTDGSVQATRGDARITPIGSFLRRTSLDELPQLINVLNGTMSLVGPRPHPVELNLRYLRLIEGYTGRHRVAPGITGLAQVHGYRGETRSPSVMQKRVEYDLAYIRNRSLGTDIWILVRTVVSVLRGSNAY